MHQHPATNWAGTLHPDDVPLASSLLRSGVPVRALSAAFQLPASEITKAVDFQRAPTAGQGVIRAYRGICGCVTFATDPDAAWEQLFSEHAGDAPPGYDARTHFTVSRVAAVDEMWNPAARQSDAFHFALGIPVHCPCCGAFVFSPTASINHPLTIGAIGSSVQPTPKLHLDRNVKRTIGARFASAEVPCVWGMQHVVCKSCWPRYQPLLPGLSKLRRKALSEHQASLPAALRTLYDPAP